MNKVAMFGALFGLAACTFFYCKCCFVLNHWFFICVVFSIFYFLFPQKLNS